MNEVIENLFVLEFYRHELGLKQILIDDYWYSFWIDTPNFKIIKSLLIVENEHCGFLFYNYSQGEWEMDYSCNYIKAE